MTEFVCPVTRQPLRVASNGEFLETATGRRYAIVDGIPELLASESRARSQTARGQDYYRAQAHEYDRGIEVLFRTFRADEAAVRGSMIERLHLSANARVLEVGCGTGRDTVHLLAHAGLVYASDLEREMVEVGRTRLQDAGADLSRVRLFLSDATALPFPDGFFDAAYHFGGLNLFPDVTCSLSELARVVRPGGRVVVGDEGVGRWLRDSEFGRILIESKPLYRCDAPLDRLPVSSRDVVCHWILNGAFYVIDFTVGEGEPALDLDVEFPGWRGGSHRTRYYGKLEGVAPELRQQVFERAAAEGLSVTAWLEKILTEKLSGR